MQSSRHHTSPLLQGCADAVPIAMGYYAVAFSLGILAGKAGLNAIMGFATSFFVRASAGEYVAYTMIAASAAYMELAAMSVIANLRYLLMSTALSQKFSPKVRQWKRVACSAFITDEVFAISIAYPGYVPPTYMLGAFLCSTMGWSMGNASGIIAGDILPQNIVSALSVALYGMFIAIIIPPARRDKAVAVAVVVSFIMSALCAIAPYVKELSSGTRTIILTIAISAAAALLRPVGTTTEEGGQ